MWVDTIQMIITSLEWETLCCPPTQSVQPALPLTISKESVVEAVYNGLAVTMGEGLKGGPGLLVGGGRGELHFLLVRAGSWKECWRADSGLRTRNRILHTIHVSRDIVTLVTLALDADGVRAQGGSD